MGGGGGKKGRGKQKSLEDSIKQLTGMEFASTNRASENRTRLLLICCFTSTVNI